MSEPVISNADAPKPKMQICPWSMHEIPYDAEACICGATCSKVIPYGGLVFSLLWFIVLPAMGIFSAIVGNMIWEATDSYVTTAIPVVLLILGTMTGIVFILRAMPKKWVWTRR